MIPFRTITRTILIALALGCGCALQYVVPGDDTGGMCPPDETSCDGVCTDVDDDPEHCGACSIGCDAGEACIDGACTAPCALEVCGTECIDTTIDPAHCGACGRQCDSSAVCTDSVCVVACSDSCDSDTELCVGGTCECRSGMIRCDDECVDPLTDVDYCGGCDVECDDTFCGGGECIASCGGLQACDESCVDSDADPLHCGGCERECHPSQSCVAGSCTSPTG